MLSTAIHSFISPVLMELSIKLPYSMAAFNVSVEKLFACSIYFFTEKGGILRRAAISLEFPSDTSCFALYSFIKCVLIKDNIFTGDS